ncbi:bifunctional 3-demethylubiquinone-9 3-methyltransferase/ 2-octaprenyl-6-hydroxy phenol methylase [Cecembia lonarensis LW9]|uniref:Bifunctional 3-demethylubiquinone-9 3-methyltransferase/ 2-octaprenyl-6-hydroxy phenol methylase n=2 Tax=Cecembia TaxID=1187078 RepID=K1L322_CECL9|nr:bifunctional 3-demethylubiquinone-9 3-methyltransferase/ 2-octaprenyl-6-hydroxy phenol methylase [Cecembia lonarensis LW9]
MERLNKCPLCKSGLFLNLQEVVDHSISGEKFMLCQCSNCQLIFTNPRPDIEHIAQYYQSTDYISHQDQSNNLTNFIYKQVRKITIKQKVSWLNQYNEKKGNLLDIGCGTGYFLEAAAKNGWSVSGIEPDQTARKLAKNKKIKVKKSISELFKKDQYQCISLYHVLEHIHELRKTGKQLSKMLKNGGTLMIAVPNINSYDAKYYGPYWAGLDVPRHLYHFTPETIQQFAELVGLKIQAIIPMKFDSYYVSLLSEKYQKVKSNIIQQYSHGLITGLKSNLWAKNNQDNYSSILFILKKV